MDFPRRKVCNWLERHAREYMDPQTREVNATALAEACAEAFEAKDVGGWLDDPINPIWELAGNYATAFVPAEK